MDETLAVMQYFTMILGTFLLALLAGCEQQSGDAKQTSLQKVAGMSDFDYLTCDGGPHLVLPKEFGHQWMGTDSVLTAANPSSDYSRACAAIANQRMALISVGSGQAMVLADPPFSSWGHSPEGWIDIYHLEAWSDTNTDALLKRAVAATPTGAMTDKGMTITLNKAGLILLFAGDKPSSTALRRA